eukprot:4686817-Prymnesium_polylepis.1
MVPRRVRSGGGVIARGPTPLAFAPRSLFDATDEYDGDKFLTTVDGVRPHSALTAHTAHTAHTRAAFPHLLTHRTTHGTNSLASTRSARARCLPTPSHTQNHTWHQLRGLTGAAATRGPSLAGAQGDAPAGRLALRRTLRRHVTPARRAIERSDAM